MTPKIRNQMSSSERARNPESPYRPAQTEPDRERHAGDRHDRVQPRAETKAAGQSHLGNQPPRGQKGAHCGAERVGPEQRADDTRRAVGIERQRARQKRQRHPHQERRTEQTEEQDDRHRDAVRGEVAQAHVEDVVAELPASRNVARRKNLRETG